MPVVNMFGKASIGMPQKNTEPFAGSIANPVGIQAKKSNNLTTLRRYLVLGLYKNMYYSQKEMFAALSALVDEIGNSSLVEQQTAVTMAKEIYDNSYYLDQETLFAFFVLASKQYAMRYYIYKDVVPYLRNGSHFLLFMRLVKELRGFGRGMRTAIEAWYNNKDENDVIFQILKYQKRYGISHKDVIFLAHPKLASKEVFNVIMGNPTSNLMAAIVYRCLQPDTPVSALNAAIREYKLPHEMINPANLSERVWQYIAENNMNFHTALWNLGAFSSKNYFRNSVIRQAVLKSIQTPPRHYNVFDYMKAYAAYAHGSGMRSTWTPDKDILKTLEAAFVNIVNDSSVNKYQGKVVFALDVSGSMTFAENGASKFPHTTAAGAAAISLYTLMRTVENYRVLMFDKTARPCPLTDKMSLSEVTEYMRQASGSSTNHTSVLDYMTAHNMDADVVVFLTDNVTTDGDQNFARAYQKFENSLGKKVRLINIAMTPMNYTATFTKAGVIELSGFDDMKMWEIALDPDLTA